MQDIKQVANTAARHIIDILLPMYNERERFQLEPKLAEAFSIIPHMKDYIDSCSKGFYLTIGQSKQLIEMRDDGFISNNTYKQLCKDLWNFGKQVWINMCLESNGSENSDDTVLNNTWSELYWSLLRKDVT